MRRQAAAVATTLAAGLAAVPAAHADAKKCVTQGIWNIKELCIDVRTIRDQGNKVYAVYVDGSARGFGGSRQEGGHQLQYQIRILENGSGSAAGWPVRWSWPNGGGWWVYTTRADSTPDVRHCSSWQQFMFNLPFPSKTATFNPGSPPHPCSPYTTNPAHSLVVAYRSAEGVNYSTPITIK